MSDSEQELWSPFIVRFKTPQRSQSRKIVTEKRIDASHSKPSFPDRYNGGTQVKKKQRIIKSNTRDVPRRLTQVVAPSPVRRTDAARSR